MKNTFDPYEISITQPQRLAIRVKTIYQ